VTAAVPDDAEVSALFAPFVLAPSARRALRLTWQPRAPGVLRANLRLESDAENTPFVSVPLTGTALNIPPKAGANWPPAQVECSGPDGSDVVLDASPSVDEDGGAAGIPLYEWIENPRTPLETLLGTGMRIARRFPLGMHRLALRVTDSRGDTDSIASTVTIADTMPPVLTVKASPALLWPPSHRMVPVRLVWSADDVCSGEVTVRLSEASSSEPDDAPGNDDGHTTGDISGVETATSGSGILLRAERSSAGTGRVYTLRFVATDAAGHVAPADAIVTVPFRRGGRRR